MKQILITASISIIVGWIVGYLMGREDARRVRSHMYEHHLWNGKRMLVDVEAMKPLCPPGHVLTINAHTGETIFKTVQQSLKEAWIKGKEHTIFFLGEE
jgi:hypothetical protein